MDAVGRLQEGLWRFQGGLERLQEVLGRFRGGFRRSRSWPGRGGAMAGRRPGAGFRSFNREYRVKVVGK